MRALCRATDWAATPLGPVDRWSTSLRTTAGIVLSSRHPMILWWGPELVQLYNDACRPSLSEHGWHPRALGRPARECWTDAWGVVGPQIERVMTVGEATWPEDRHVPIERNGRLDDARWAYGYIPVPDDGGSIGGTLAVYAETTQRVLAERQVGIVARAPAVERERLEYIFRHAPAFLAVVRGPEHVIQLANAAFVALMGGRELIGRPAFAVIPEMRERFRPSVDQVFATGERVIGREVPAQLQATPDAVPEEHFFDVIYVPFIEPDGTRSGVIVHGTDVTAHVHARRRLKRLAGLERTSRGAAEANARARDEVLGIVAHDLGNLVAAIEIAATALIEDAGPPALPAAARRTLEVVKHGVRSMNRLIRDLTEVASIEAGSLGLDVQDVAPATALEATVELFTTAAREAGVALALQVPPGLPTVRADPERLLQALGNLVANALEFVRTGGRITLRAELRPTGVRLSVQDTGAGIAAGDLPHVFDRYWHKRRAGGKRGIGLGLAIVRGIVEAHGGTIDVESTPGEGSEFSFTIPALDWPPPDRQRERDPPPRSERRTGYRPRISASIANRT